LFIARHSDEALVIGAKALQSALALCFMEKIRLKIPVEYFWVIFSSLIIGMREFVPSALKLTLFQQAQILKSFKNSC
jgi:hypothetical protein